MARLTVLVLLLAACRGAPRPCAGACTGATTTQRWDDQRPRVFDVLFIIDPRILSAEPRRISAAMQELAAQFEKLPYPYPLDLRVVVVSSVPGPDGQPVNLLGSACPRNGAFVADGHFTCGVGPNFQGGLGQALGCLTVAAPDGASQPLAVARTLLDPARRPAAYQGIIRDETWRLLVIVSPRPDTSREPTDDPAALDAYYQALTPTRRPTLSLAVITDVSPLIDGGARCALTSDQPGRPAQPGIDRWLALIDAAGAKGTIVDLCASDWSVAYREALSFPSFDRIYCLPEGTRDLDPMAAGLQPDCVVSQITEGPAGPVTTLLPPCTSGQRPCTEYISDVTCQSSGGRLVVRRDCLPHGGTQYELTCGQEARP